METDQEPQRKAEGEAVNVEAVIANAILISLLALRMDSAALYKATPDVLRRLQEILRLSLAFMNLLQSRVEKQSIDIFPVDETDWQEWLKRLHQLIIEKGLGQDQEIRAAAQELVPYGNELMEITEKLFSDKLSSNNHGSLLGRTGLPGDSTTDAPPPKK
jgi:hypothetical protein